MLEMQLQNNGSVHQDNRRTLQYFRILHDECVRESTLINDLLCPLEKRTPVVFRQAQRAYGGWLGDRRLQPRVVPNLHPHIGIVGDDACDPRILH